jgi:hypothetical protein
MQDKNRIHLVPQREPRRAKLYEIQPVKPSTDGPLLDAKDIVRETLAIARECGEVIAIHPTSSPLLVDLVASLAVARLKKRGQR